MFEIFLWYRLLRVGAWFWSCLNCIHFMLFHLENSHFYASWYLPDTSSSSLIPDRSIKLQRQFLDFFRYLFDTSSIHWDQILNILSGQYLLNTYLIHRDIYMSIPLDPLNLKTQYLLDLLRLRFLYIRMGQPSSFQALSLGFLFDLSQSFLTQTTKIKSPISFLAFQLHQFVCMWSKSVSFLIFHAFHASHAS